MRHRTTIVVMILLADLRWSTDHHAVLARVFGARAERSAGLPMGGGVGFDRAAAPRGSGFDGVAEYSADGRRLHGHVLLALR